MFELYHSKVIEDNLDRFNVECEYIARNIRNKFNTYSTTDVYQRYCLLNMVGNSDIWWYLYQDITKAVRQYLGHKRPLWAQIWLNTHKYEDDPLPWHRHDGVDCHGFVSIDPKNTVTEFKTHTIVNEPGKIYVGPPAAFHRVVNRGPWDGERYTVAFDIKQGETHPELLLEADHNRIRTFPIPNIF